MVEELLKSAENLIIQGLVDHYPNWWLSPYIISIGKRIDQRIAQYPINDKLFTFKPSASRHWEMMLMLARDTAASVYVNRVKEEAMVFYENCYFQHYNEAIFFFSALFYPRYTMTLVRNMVWRLLHHQRKLANMILYDLEIDYLVMITRPEVR